MSKEVKNAFNKYAKEYDLQRRKFIPCFDDFYNAPMDFINISKDAPRVLDIGAGTGLFSAFLLNKFPKAHITLIDVAEDMLAEAKSRFAGNPNIEYICGDYTTYNFQDRFDIVISALSIHHLTDEQKEELY